MNDNHEIVKYLEQIAANNLAKKGLKELPGLGKKATNKVAEDERKIKSFGYPSIVSLLAIVIGISIMLSYGYYLVQDYYVHRHDVMLILYCLSMTVQNYLIILCLLKSPSTRPLLPWGTPQSEKEPHLVEV